MQAELREQYLQAMGIEPWVPRLQPIAAPEVRWLSETQAVTPPVVVAESAAPAPDITAAATTSLASPDKQPAQRPDLGVVLDADAPRQKDISKKGSVAKRPGETTEKVWRCHYQLRASAGLLLLDCQPSTDPRRQRLLDNICLALAPSGNRKSVLTDFIWPDSKAPGLGKSADIAAEALVGLLDGRAQQQQTQKLLIVGSSELLEDQDALKNFACYRVESIEACTNSAEAKRELWRVLKAL